MFTKADEGELRRRLAETIAWCMPRASAESPRESTRTTALTPASLNIEVPRREPFDNNEWLRDYVLLLPSRVELVSLLASQRRRLLAESEGVVNPALPEKPDGRILLVAHDIGVRDGLSEYHSGGFFDIYDVPGWDTWLWYTFQSEAILANTRYHPHEYLLFWVPPFLVDLAGAGLDANCVNCIQWADDSDCAHLPEIQFLRSEGWV